MPTKPVRPHITEKSVARANANAPQYTLRISRDMSKTLVKRVLERDHKVTVLSVRTHINPGKVRKFRGIVGHTKAYKYAIVTLKPGQKLELFDSMLATGEETPKEEAK